MTEMTIKDVLTQGIKILKSAGNESPAAEAGVMLCMVVNRDKSFIYAHGDYIIDAAECSRYFSLVNLRAEGTPLQYITGHQEFMSLDFAVNSGVLIPRQDTEVLVETVINYANKKWNEGILADNTREAKNAASKATVRILDIGTGSGCIAVSLAHYIKGCCVTALDISEKALDTARFNAKLNGVSDRVEFIQSNVFSALKEKPCGGVDFDIIVSNPPYIPSSQIETLQIEVKGHEPLNALDGGYDGLDFYRTISEEAVGFLKPGGILAFEVGFDQTEAVCKLMANWYDDITTIKDLAGIERVVIGRLKEHKDTV